MGTPPAIESTDACRLATSLSGLTGEIPPTVVIKAIQAEPDRQREIQARVNRKMEIATEIRAQMREPVSSDTNWMHDHGTGRPK